VCGRYTLTLPPDLLAEAFGLDDVPELEARYNIAPTQPVPVVRRLRPGGPRQLDLLRWGLSLAPVQGAKGSGPIINARAESVATRSAFRDAFRRRRCLIPADGFYEWGPGRPPRQPFHIRRGDGRPLALAGLWEPEEAGTPASCVILTTEPNELVRPIHDRMPVIVDPSDYDRWLAPDGDAAALSGIFRPCPEEVLTARPVGPAVNRASNDSPACLDPA
jgi:putative SOS response-associated peptidase YedK